MFMSQSTVSRIRFCLIALGCVVLCASLFNWARGLHTGASQYTWVTADASNAPPVDTVEIWQVSATCARPYFIRALLRAKAKLKAYYDLAPEAVRARLNRTPDVPQTGDSANWYRLVKNDWDSPQPSNENADTEYVAQLHVQYAEWYANVFKLEIEESQWERRLIDIADHRLSFSETTRKSFGISSGSNTAPAGATNGFDNQVLTTLGLAGFPPDEEQALKTDCVKISLMNKVMENPNYFSRLWPWVSFALGLELFLLGLFLAPMTLWIGTGNGQGAAQHIRQVSSGIAATVRDFDWQRLVADAVERLQVAGRTALAVLADLGARLRPVVEEQIVLLLRRVVLPAIALGSRLWQRCVALLRGHPLL